MHLRAVMPQALDLAKGLLESTIISASSFMSSQGNATCSLASWLLTCLTSGTWLLTPPSPSCPVAICCGIGQGLQERSWEKSAREPNSRCKPWERG